MSKPVNANQRKPLCARCRKQAVAPEYRPFCSKRCADADLGQWLTASYVIPGAAAEQADDTAGPADAEDDTDSR